MELSAFDLDFFEVLLRISFFFNENADRSLETGDRKSEVRTCRGCQKVKVL